MKKFFLVCFPFAIGLAVLLASCASVASAASGVNVSAGINESLIVIKRNSNFIGSLVSLNIFIDGKQVATVGNGKEVRFAVENGKHTIKGINASFKSVETGEIAFEAYSMEITFAAGFDEAGIQIIKTNKKKLEGSGNRDRLASDSGIEGAVYRSSQSLINDLPKNATIAVLSVSSSNRGGASLAIDELEYQLVNSKMFKIVERKTLDAIRSEQNFQMSGEVSDESAISTGNMLGASIVITGSISGFGDSLRLTLKALDVKTSQIITMTREQFR